MDIRITWEEFKSAVDSHSLSVTYIDKNGNYYLFSMRNEVQLVCVLDKGDASEFEDSYKDNATSIT